MSPWTRLYIGFLGPCNSKPVWTCFAPGCFRFNFSNVSSGTGFIPLLKLLANGRNAPFTFLFYIDYLDLKKTFSVFIDVLVDVSLAFMVLLLLTSSLTSPFPIISLILLMVSDDPAPLTFYLAFVAVKLTSYKLLSLLYCLVACHWPRD